MKRILDSVLKARIKFHENNGCNYANPHEAVIKAQEDIANMKLYYYVAYYGFELYDVDEENAKSVHPSNGKVFDELYKAKIYQLKMILQDRIFLSVGQIQDYEKELEELGIEYPEYAL